MSTPRARKEVLLRETISAKYLLAAPIPTTVVYDPAMITHISARRARGAYKPMSSGGCGSAMSTKNVAALGDRRVILNLASKGY